MKIVATILSGNSQSLVSDAIVSVRDYMDQLLLIDTGITDETVARAEAAAGEKLKVLTFPWCDDFAAARNFALNAASEFNANWALTIDTDERVNFSSLRTRDALIARLNQRDDTMAWMVAAADHSYAKERFIRVPTSLTWVGRTHEALIGASDQARELLDDVHFWETPKSAEQYRHKLERDLRILETETAKDPGDARWWYYLGQTLDGMGETERALEAYQSCARNEGWNEQLAWSSYCAAKCLTRMHRFRDAEEAAAYGLTIDAGFAELPWIAGWACYQRDALEQAVAWSNMAANMGEFAARSLRRPRVGFRFLPAWYEAPYDTLRHALRKLGEFQAADRAEKCFRRAKQLRLGGNITV
ncbi:glycosyltransferase [Allorhodopirellula solitaria]|uniref:glycosyltransferase n=1 Tax=Allorhodopirellula solitaria TaxID=2527987 RepID=UPI00164786E4|nr:glycosyltransferase [Allorhodopirellula solitaria]